MLCLFVSIVFYCLLALPMEEGGTKLEEEMIERRGGEECDGEGRRGD